MYGYPQALRDRVCRPITFLPYEGEMEWRSDGRLRRMGFDVVLPRVESARRLRTAAWTAMSDDEQAVSSVSAGPWVPRK